MIARRVWRAGLVLALLVAAAFTVVAPPERCPSVTTAELRGSAQASVDWFARNQDADGSWLYLYDAEDDSTPPDYNEVRHAGVTMGLYQAAAAGLPGASRRTGVPNGRSRGSFSTIAGPRSTTRARSTRAPPRSWPLG